MANIIEFIKLSLTKKGYNIELTKISLSKNLYYWIYKLQTLQDKLSNIVTCTKTITIKIMKILR